MRNGKPGASFLRGLVCAVLAALLPAQFAAAAPRIYFPQDSHGNPIYGGGAPVTLPDPPPATGNEAITSFASRSDAYATAYACLQEGLFVDRLYRELLDHDDPDYTLSNGQGRTSDTINFAIAKLQWLKHHEQNACVGPYPVDPSVQAAVHTAILGELQQIPHLSGPCGGANVSFPAGQIKVSKGCIVAELNYALHEIKRGYARPGTSGLPCYIYGQGSVTGDWDFQMKSLIRIVYLDASGNQNQSSPSFLADIVAPTDDGLTTLEYIKQKQIILDGGPNKNDSYAWEDCGDNEADTGSAQDREDEQESSDDFLNSVGDFLKWLFWRLILIAAFLGITGVLAAAALEIPIIPALVTVAGLATILSATIPETENHRLMIESTRFLNNQLIIAELGADEAPKISEEQQDVKQWLLTRMQQIAEGDFVEYNARPYHGGYAIGALQNLADFSTDVDVRNGATILLSFSAAKFAVSSNQGRRQVPFRRHFAATDCIDGRPCPVLDGSLSGNTTYKDMFDDYYQLGDGDVSAGTLYFGQTQQLIRGPSLSDPSPIYAQPTFGAMNDAMQVITNRVLVDARLADVTIRKGGVYYQRIHNAGYEIYSSGPNALITAGGIQTDHAYSFHTLDIPISGGSPKDPADDLGAGVPTSVMFTAGLADVTTPLIAGDSGQPYPPRRWAALNKFISFRGTYETKGSDEGTFTDNLCVWMNFACGTNVTVPPDLQGCFQQSTAGGNFWYLNSNRCAGYSNSDSINSPPGSAPRSTPVPVVPTHFLAPIHRSFFLVLYLLCKTAPCTPFQATASNSGTAGFLEIIDNAPSPSARDAEFSALIASVESSNPPGAGGFSGGLTTGCVTGDPCQGTYVTRSGHTLQLDLRGHQDNADSTGILSIDGTAESPISTWPLATGEVIQSTGNGMITLGNPNTKEQWVLDFRDVNHPCTRANASAPCDSD